MVDPLQLTSDIVENTVSLALPGLLWAILFLLAWEREPFAESIGFGRRAFWLLFPGAILATFGILPIAPISDDWLAVSFSGALFPLLVGLLAFGRAAPPRSRSLSRYLLLLAVEGALLLALVLPPTVGLSQAVAGVFGVSEYVGNDLLILLVAAAFAAVVSGLASLSSDAVARRVAFLFVITSGVLGVTFLAASAVPAVGITETFPIYLVPPIGAGLVAVAFAGRVFPKEEAFALPTAFLGSTFGVLLGADLLRQPPLYGTGPAGLYTIGGAGVMDLVYLSGLLAYGTAFLCHRAFGRAYAPVGTPLPAAPPNPLSRLTRAFREGLDGRLSESLTDSDAASRAGADQARRLLDLAPAPTDRPWQGLAVPGWIVADQANLDASARAGTTDGREGFRSWRTARWMVGIGREIGLRRFGTIRARIGGFLIDVVIVTVPAVLLWTALLVSIPGGFVDALSNVTFNAAIFGFISWAFLYFVLAETFWGTTPGKRLLGLEVRDRSLDPAGGLSSLVRNTTVLPLLTVVGLGGAIALALVVKVGTSSTLAVAGVALPSELLALLGILTFLLAGVALLGGGGVLIIALTAERQRLGDLWAGTWVVRRPSTPSVPTAAARGTVPPGAEGPPSPPGRGPSG